jgi:SAM-dependent methyltransferase
VEDRSAEKAREFDTLAGEVFAPVYPVIAARLLELAEKRRGCCLDLGCGGGHLGFAAAAMGFEGKIILLDSNPWALELADTRIPQNDRDRIRTLCADVRAMPIPSESVDLIISRGSLWFWDKQESLTEIWRVLAPAGTAIIGGGYGSSALKKEIYRKMTERNGVDYAEQRRKKTAGFTPDDYKRELDEMGIPGRVIHEGSGDWLLFRKSPRPPPAACP